MAGILTQESFGSVYSVDLEQLSGLLPTTAEENQKSDNNSSIRQVVATSLNQVQTYPDPVALIKRSFPIDIKKPTKRDPRPMIPPTPLNKIFHNTQQVDYDENIFEFEE